ncbi:ribonuclease D [Eggerthella sp. CAG:368]|nr:ribonuclease D [Eggerthella sp. CAG:368]
MLIDDDSQLKAFVKRCCTSPYMAIDTEFLREKTYYARLCLIQVAIEGEVAIIDPFAIKDITLLNDALTSPDVVKIFHASSQDIEILYHETGVVPRPVFDTQIAAALLGKSQQASYSSLVSSYCSVNLPKKDSFTDWSQRPLKDSQIRYAADDVVYLPQIYYDMVEVLNEKNRLHWLDEAFEEISSPEKYEIKPEERYRKLRRVNQLNAQQMAAAREFAAWRELKAQKINVPRKWIVSDEQIVEACRREARTIDELFMVRGMRESLRAENARQAVACIKKGLSCPKEQLPQVHEKPKNEHNVDIVVDLMNAVVHLRARENHIAPQTLAPQAELMKLARGHDDECELLKGWRYKVIGKELKELLKGKFSLRIADGNLEIIR